MILTIYLIGCILSLLCSIYEIRKAGKLTVLDAGICIIAVFLSFVYVIAFLGNKFANNWDTVIWEKK